MKNMCLVLVAVIFLVAGCAGAPVYKDRSLPAMEFSFYEQMKCGGGDPPSCEFSVPRDDNFTREIIDVFRERFKEKIASKKIPDGVSVIRFEFLYGTRALVHSNLAEHRYFQTQMSVFKNGVEAPILKVPKGTEKTILFKPIVIGRPEVLVIGWAKFLAGLYSDILAEGRDITTMER